jgi:outer membrane protein
MGNGVWAAGTTVLALILCGCTITEPPPFDPREMQRVEETQSQRVRSRAMYPLPTTMQSYGGGQPSTRRSATPSEVVRLPLREIMQRAAANSLEVRVAGYDPAVAATRVVEDQAHFDLTFFTNVKYDKQFDRTAGTVIPNPFTPQTNNITINVENNNIYTVESGIKQNLPSGGQIQISYQTQQSDYSPIRFIRNNYWDQQLKFQITQPLLRQFGYAVNNARITIGRNDQRISMLDYRKALEDNTNELEKDYWQLYEAQDEVNVQEELLVRTRELARVLWEQYRNGGKATHVEASQGDVAVSQHEATLVRARARVQDISDDIKRRMNDPDPALAVAGPVEILAGDAPVTQPFEFELEDQIDTAMLNRLELGQQQIRVSSSDIARQVALNGLYPKLDIVASAALQGLSAKFGDAVSDQFSNGHGIYSIGLNLEIPLGNREALAVVRRAQLQQMQAMVAYRNLIAQVSEDVTVAVREVQTTWEEMRHTREARLFQEDVLKGLNQRRLSGVQPLDPEFVRLSLDEINLLGEAHRLEATAISKYNIALGQLEKAKGTILRYNNILMAEDEDVWNLPGASHKSR